jgi:tRNA pseudouridine 55 synthase
VNGLLNVNKPAGMTSHDVVAKVRRALKTKRVGHAGTLDPDAMGVLVVAVGSATRLLPHLPLEPKVYVARVVFGVATDTEDASGRETERADASGLREADIAAALPAFLGEIAQIPPMVSAVHHEGRRLYELARQGVTVERQPRTVRIHSLDLSGFVSGVTAEATLAVTCGGGTYIRTLCKDIGKALGLPAHMKTLVREAVGPFRRAEAVPLDRLEAPDAANALIPAERCLGLPLLAVTEGEARRILQGQPVERPAQEAGVTDGGEVALLYHERLLALARRDEGAGVYRPFKVFGEAVSPQGANEE